MFSFQNLTPGPSGIKGVKGHRGREGPPVSKDPGRVGSSGMHPSIIPSSLHALGALGATPSHAYILTAFPPGCTWHTWKWISSFHLCVAPSHHANKQMSLLQVRCRGQQLGSQEAFHNSALLGKISLEYATDRTDCSCNSSVLLSDRDHQDPWGLQDQM